MSLIVSAFRFNSKVTLTLSTQLVRSKLTAGRTILDRAYVKQAELVSAHAK